MIKLYICCLVLIIGSVEVGPDKDMKFHQEVMEIVSYDIWLGIWRCNGPERHEMLTVINAYYGYYGILLIHWILHYFIGFCTDSSDFALIHLF